MSSQTSNVSKQILFQTPTTATQQTTQDNMSEPAARNLSFMQSQTKVSAFDVSTSVNQNQSPQQECFDSNKNQIAEKNVSGAEY